MTATIRQATLEDARGIHALIAAHVGENRLLPRSLESITASIDEWLVAEDDMALAGCVTLSSFGKGLAEVRSLVVDGSYQGNGLGGRLVRRLLELAGQEGYEMVFTLTTAVAFFERQGFAITSRRHFPLKIWRDCLGCPVKFRCDEVTMVYANGRGM